MRILSKDIYTFTIKVAKPNGSYWECPVNNIPHPDMEADTIEKSEKSASYEGESNEYSVNVFCNSAEITVAVYDKNGKEVENFSIEDIKTTDC